MAEDKNNHLRSLLSEGGFLPTIPSQNSGSILRSGYIKFSGIHNRLNQVHILRSTCELSIH
jgi:hypothetical protein